MSIFDPHGYYFSKKYNTARGQIIQKKPIDPPYQYDLGANISKIKTYGYSIYKTLSTAIKPTAIFNWYLELSDIYNQSPDATISVSYPYQSVISQFRDSFDFTVFNNLDINNIESIDFGIYADAFSIATRHNSTFNVSLTTYSIENVDIGIGIPYSNQISQFFVQNKDTEKFIVFTNGTISRNKTIASDLLCGNFATYNTPDSISQFLSSLTGQTQFPGLFIFVSMTSPGTTVTNKITIANVPTHIEIYIHFKTI